MKIYIPALGDVLVLDKDWTFDLHMEYRNSAAWERWTGKKMDYQYGAAKATERVTLQAGCQLVVDRIYIKKGAPSYNSVTFRHSMPGQGKKVSTRFWAKLHDVNTMEASPLS